MYGHFGGLIEEKVSDLGGLEGSGSLDHGLEMSLSHIGCRL